MLRRAFSNAPVMVKIASTVVLILLVTFFFVYVSMFVIRQNMEAEITTVGDKALEFYAQGVDAQINALEEYSFSVITLPNIQTPLMTLASDGSAQEKLDASISLRAALETAPLYLNCVRDVYLIDGAGTAYSPESAVRAPVLSADNLALIREAKGAPVWLPPSAPDGTIALCRTINTVRNDFQYIPIGTEILTVDFRQLTDSASLQEDFYNSGLLVVDGSGEILYATSYAQTGATFSEADFTDSFILLSRQLTSTDWSLKLIIPKSDLFSTMDSVMHRQSVLFLAMLACAVVLSFYCAGKLTRPLELLCTEMTKVSRGNFSVDEEALLCSAGQDEIGEICRHFVGTANRLEKLIDENYKFQLSQKEAQIRALQAQINPHFVYNALDSVNWLAKMSHQEEICTIVQSLSRILRSAMRTSDACCTLRDEVCLVRDYIAIQKVRFGQRLEFREEIDETLLDLPIPALILQPIVENSIKYAVEAALDPCCITLRVGAAPGGACRIDIEDNGPGISGLPAGELSASQLVPKGTGIGLANVEKRLRLLYGIHSSIRICNTEGHGLAVSLCIPLRGGA